MNELKIQHARIRSARFNKLNFLRQNDCHVHIHSQPVGTNTGKPVSASHCTKTTTISTTTNGNDNKRSNIILTRTEKLIVWNAESAAFHTNVSGKRIYRNGFSIFSRFTSFPIEILKLNAAFFGFSFEKFYMESESEY